MLRARIRLSFEGESEPPTVLERELEVQVPRNRQGEEYVAEYLLSELDKEMAVHAHYTQLPETEDIWNQTTMRFTLDDLANQEYFNRVNTHWVWFEISNLFLRAKYLLAQSRAIKDAEVSLGGDTEKKNVLYNLHFRKMDFFDLAVVLLAKVQDLFFRLLFENLGASLVPISPEKHDWERLLTRDRIADGLKNRAGNPKLAALSENEYQEIKRIFDAFANPHYVQAFTAYRDRFAHRLTPAVDYPGMAAAVENRTGTPIFDQTGRQTGTSWSFGGSWAGIDYKFLDLYDDTTKTMEHWVSLLRELKKLPRFIP